VQVKRDRFAAGQPETWLRYVWARYYERTTEQFVVRDPVAATTRTAESSATAFRHRPPAEATSRSPGTRERDHSVSGAQDCLVLDFATHSDLTGRLRGLIILLAGRLTLDQARSADELIDASEFGVALEMLADWLSENETPIPDGVRRDFERLSVQMGNVERVMRPLDLCPAESDS
jgi:hypothetical protein